MVCQSRAFTDAARMRTSTRPSISSGLGMSRTWRTSADPCPSCTSAFIVTPLFSALSAAALTPVSALIYPPPPGDDDAAAYEAIVNGRGLRVSGCFARVTTLGVRWCRDAVILAPCILVIDDDPNIRGLLRMLLGENGYRVETAIDGRDGLDQLRSAPDLILLDITMPTMDGHEFMRRLRRSDGHSRTPVLVVSASTDEVVGVQGALRKPFENADLLRRVSALVGA